MPETTAPTPSAGAKAMSRGSAFRARIIGGIVITSAIAAILACTLSYYQHFVYGARTPSDTLDGAAGFQPFPAVGATEPPPLPPLPRAENLDGLVRQKMAEVAAWLPAEAKVAVAVRIEILDAAEAKPRVAAIQDEYRLRRNMEESLARNKEFSFVDSLAVDQTITLTPAVWRTPGKKDQERRWLRQLQADALVLGLLSVDRSEHEGKLHVVVFRKNEDTDHGASGSASLGGFVLYEGAPRGPETEISVNIVVDEAALPVKISPSGQRIVELPMRKPYKLLLRNSTYKLLGVVALVDGLNTMGGELPPLVYTADDLWRLEPDSSMEIEGWRVKDGDGFRDLAFVFDPRERSRGAQKDHFREMGRIRVMFYEITRDGGVRGGGTGTGPAIDLTGRKDGEGAGAMAAASEMAKDPLGVVSLEYREKIP